MFLKTRVSTRACPFLKRAFFAQLRTPGKANPVVGIEGGLTVLGLVASAIVTTSAESNANSEQNNPTGHRLRACGHRSLVDRLPRALAEGI